MTKWITPPWLPKDDAGAELPVPDSTTLEYHRGPDSYSEHLIASGRAFELYFRAKYKRERFSSGGAEVLVWTEVGWKHVIRDTRTCATGLSWEEGQEPIPDAAFKPVRDRLLAIAVAIVTGEADPSDTAAPSQKSDHHVYRVEYSVYLSGHRNGSYDFAVARTAQDAVYMKLEPLRSQHPGNVQLEAVREVPPDTDIYKYTMDEWRSRGWE